MKKAYIPGIRSFLGAAFTALTLATTVTSGVNAQILGSNWQEIGPRRLRVGLNQGFAPSNSFVSGRINNVAYSPDGTKIYITSGQGGVWKSANNGVTWESLTTFGLTGNWPYRLYLSALDIDRDGNIYVGSGDIYNENRQQATSTIPAARDLQASRDTQSGGIFRSADDGQTWQRIPNVTSPSFANFRNVELTFIKVDPDDPQIIIAGTRANGLLRSTNGGNSWTVVRPGGHTTISVGPTGAPLPAPQLAYYVTVVGTGVFRSLDKGATWQQLQLLPLPMGFTRGNALSVSASQSQAGVLYLMEASSTAADGRIYKYTLNTSNLAQLTPTEVLDLSATFPLSADGTGGPLNIVINNFSRALRAAFVIASPATLGGDITDVLYAGTVSVATALGPEFNWQDVSFTLSQNTTTHFEQHDYAYHPITTLMGAIVNDGGIYRMEYDAVRRFFAIQDANQDLRITQVHKADWSNTDPIVMIAATQDNFTAVPVNSLNNWRTTAFTSFNLGSTRQFDSTSIAAAINPLNNDIQYSMDISGNVFRTTDRWQSFAPIAAGTGWGNTNVVTNVGPLPGVAFPGVAITPAEVPQASLFVGTDHLFRYTEGSGWLTDFATPARLKALGGTRLANADGATITAVAVAPNPLFGADGRVFVDRGYPVTAGNVVYVGTSNGLIYRTARGLAQDRQVPGGIDETINWTQITDPNGSGPITAISVNPNNAADILVAQGPVVKRCANTFSAAFFYTNQSGFGAGTALPQTVITGIARDPGNPERSWYVSTDLGVFATDNSGSSYVDLTTEYGLPRIVCTSIKATDRAPRGTGKLYVSTYGRGIWVADLPPMSAPQLQTAISVRREGTQFRVAVNILNRGGQANQVVLNTGTLRLDNGVVLTPVAPTVGLPFNLGAIPGGGSRTVALFYNVSYTTGNPPRTVPIRPGSAATYNIGIGTRERPFSFSGRIRLP